jgi:hypothetical protein
MVSVGCSGSSYRVRGPLVGGGVEPGGDQMTIAVVFWLARIVGLCVWW